MTNSTFGRFSLRISDYEIPIVVVPGGVLPADALFIGDVQTPGMVYLANIRLPNTTNSTFICSVNPAMGSKAVLVRGTKKKWTKGTARGRGTK